MITILLMDPFPIVREGLKAVLGIHEGFRVIGEAGNGHEAVALAERLSPHVLIGDIFMPGAEVIRQVQQRVPRTRILVMSRYINEIDITEALKNGAVGYIRKGIGVHELLQAVREVASGHRYICPFLNNLMNGEQASSSWKKGLDPYQMLTMREREILHLIAKGYTNVEMATLLGISPRTVETHRAHLMKKLSIRSQAELIRYALQRALRLPDEA